MADADLEAIRAARIEQLKAQDGGSRGRGGGGAKGGSGGSSGGGEDRQEQESARREATLDLILEPGAKDRLGTIRLVKESRATEVENRLILMAQTGRIQQKVTEKELKAMLEAVAEKKEEEKIKVDRRKKRWDDDDDLNDLLDD